MELRDNTAIVTGGGSGLGRGISLLFAKEGANVIAADFSIDGGRKTVVAAIEAAGGRASFVQGDITNPQYHLDLVAAAARSRYGKLDIARPWSKEAEA